MADFMKFFPRFVLLAALLGTTALQAADAPTPAAAWKSDLLAWRAEQAKNLQKPDGWLTLIGLEWLKPGDNSFGSAKGNAIVVKAPTPANLGLVKLDGSSLQLLSPKSGYPAGLMVDGKAPASPQSLTSDNPGKPSRITTGSVIITIIHRGDRYALRIKNTQSPERVHFKGLKWFPPNEAYRVTAKWTPYNPPRQVPVPTILGTVAQFEGKFVAFDPKGWA